MNDALSPTLSRRERQIMDIIHRSRRATAAEIHVELPNPPGYSAVRTLLRVLERKGHIRHDRDGQRYVYFANESREHARRSAVKRLLDTFCGGSAEEAVAALLDAQASNLSEAELNRMLAMIEEAKRRGQ